MIESIIREAMEKNIKHFALMALTTLVIGFLVVSFLRSSPPAKIDQTTQQVKDTEVKRRTTTVKKPNGEVKTIITVDSTSRTKTDTKVSKSTKRSKTNLTLLGGYNITQPGERGFYGGMITAPIANGPFTWSAYGITDSKNTIVGGGIGVDF